MVGAQTTIKRATVLHRGIETPRVFRSFVVVADVFVVFNVVGNFHLKKTVLRAGFAHDDLAIFKDNFRINPAQALRAKADGVVVIGVAANGHMGWVG